MKSDYCLVTLGLVSLNLINKVNYMSSNFDDNKYLIYLSPCFMPNGRPVPELLNESETIEFLRLNEDGPKNPSNTLQYYRDKGLLRATRVGKRIRYQKRELLILLDKLTVWTNKNTA